MDRQSKLFSRKLLLTICKISKAVEAKLQDCVDRSQIDLYLLGQTLVFNNNR